MDYCEACGRPQGDLEAEAACPDCGGTAIASGGRPGTMALGASVPPPDRVTGDGLHVPGKKRPRHEDDVKNDLHRDTGRPVAVRRRYRRPLSDDDPGWYDEVVVDRETDEVYHERAHPLRDHRGHGAARQS